MPIDDRTTNRNYQLPNAGNQLSDDVARLRAALQAIDADVFARYTKTEVDTLINNLINGAPGALDTLNELAAAMGDDPNFAATVTNSIAAINTELANRYTKAESDARYVQGAVQTEMVFTAGLNQTAYTLTTGVINKASALVTVDGVVQPTSEYSLSMDGLTLTLSEAPAQGAKVRVLALGVASAGAPADDTVTTAKLRDGALAATTAGLAKMADGFFSATTAALAKFADGFLSATTAGRAKMADGYVTEQKLADGAVTPAKLSQPLTIGTAAFSVATTVIDFTGIPSWAKRVNVMINGVSTNGTGLVLIQLGTSAGVVSSGYVGVADNRAATGGPVSYTSGLYLERSVDAGCVRQGIATFNLVGSNQWVGSYRGTITGSLTNISDAAATISLPSALTRVRIVTSNGVDGFDAGTVNILYEG